MSIKVLVISNYRDTTSVRPEAEIFIGLQKAGFQIDIMTYGDAEYVNRFKKAGIRVIDFHPEKKFSGEAKQRIRKELITGKHQIMHLFNSPAIHNGIRAAKGLPVKVVLYRGYTGNINWWDPLAYFKYLNPRVDKIFCLARSVEEMFHRQLFFDKSKTITIHKGHSLDWYKDIAPLPLKDINIPEGAFTAACVANARRMKDIPTLIRSTYHIPVDYPIHFLLVGNGMDTPEVMKLIEKSPNKGKIHLTGFRKDVLRITKASDIFLLTSIKGEAITKSVIEAMALGTAPVISNVPGNRDLVIHEKCGLVVPMRRPEKFAEAIIRMYKHPELVKEYGVQAQKQIETNFNTKKTVQQTKELYEELAGQIKTNSTPGT